MAERIAETEEALTLLRGAQLQSLYPSPAALQLYVLGDQIALNEQRAPLANSPPYTYVPRPSESRSNLLRMSDALRNASVWLGESLETQVYERRYGMRDRYPNVYALLRQQTVYELAALQPGAELTQARMERVAALWMATRDEKLRMIERFENTFKSDKAAYRRSLRNEATRERLQLRFEALVRDFRQTAYKTAFLDTLQRTRTGPPPRKPTTPPLPPQDDKDSDSGSDLFADADSVVSEPVGGGGGAPTAPTSPDAQKSVTFAPELVRVKSEKASEGASDESQSVFRSTRDSSLATLSDDEKSAEVAPSPEQPSASGEPSALANGSPDASASPQDPPLASLSDDEKSEEAAPSADQPSASGGSSTPDASASPLRSTLGSSLDSLPESADEQSARPPSPVDASESAFGAASLSERASVPARQRTPDASGAPTPSQSERASEPRDDDVSSAVFNPVADDELVSLAEPASVASESPRLTRRSARQSASGSGTPTEPTPARSDDASESVLGAASDTQIPSQPERASEPRDDDDDDVSSAFFSPVADDELLSLAEPASTASESARSLRRSARQSASGSDRPPAPAPALPRSTTADSDENSESVFASLGSDEL